MEEGGGVAVLDGNDYVALKIGKTDVFAVIDEDAVVGGVPYFGIATGEDLSARGIDKAGEKWTVLSWLDGNGGVLNPYATIAAGELVDIAEDVGEKDFAVAAAETVEVAFACGLNSVDIDDVATAGGVGVVGDVLRVRRIEN